MSGLDFTDVSEGTIAQDGQLFGGDCKFLFGFGSGHCSDSFYVDLAHDPLWFRPLEIDSEQAVLQLRILHLDTIRQNERTLELTGSDAPVEIGAGSVINLTAPYNELVFLKRDFKFVA